ncbi:MAG: TolC family protein [Candidatus Riflebacteria bacterium]|nr:TolC family protein [Candidatus Riflebacteria bacterium]
MKTSGFPRSLAWLAILLVLASAGNGEAVRSTRPASDPTEALVRAHLEQTRALSNVRSGVASTQPGASPGTDEALERSRVEIAAARDRWTRRIEARPSLQGRLLKGIPAVIVRRVDAMAGDARAAGSILAKGASCPLVLALVAGRNPEVQAAYEALRAVHRQFDQASYLEDLVSRYRSFTRELDTRVGPQSHKEMSEKTFPFPANLALKGHLVQLASEIALLRYQQTLRKALDDAGRGYVQVYFDGRMIALTEENRKLVSEMEALTRTQVAAGVATQADLLKAQSTLATMVNQAESLARQRIADIAQVNALMGLTTTPWGGVRDPGLAMDVPTREGLLKRALSNSQELAMADKDVEQMETMVRMAESMTYPRGSVGYTLVAPSTGAEAGPTRSMMAAFPLRQEPDVQRAAFGAQAAYLDELRVRIVRAKREREAARVKVELAVNDAWARVQIARRTLSTQEREIVPRARQSYQTMRVSYGTGRTSFLDLLDGARMVVMSSQAVEEARRDFWKSRIDLEEAAGGSACALLR